jgi:hypothetical protein
MFLEPDASNSTQAEKDLHPIQRMMVDMHKELVKDDLTEERREFCEELMKLLQQVQKLN